MTHFVDIWRSFHGDVTPVNYRLKYEKKDLWQRFHSLPESQRYATTDDEMAVVLHRQNTLAREVLGENTPCWLIGHLYAFDKAQTTDADWRHKHAGRPYLHVMTKAHHVVDPDDAEQVFDIFAGRAVWRDGAFDDALRAIANDEIRIMWMSANTGAILAPYDGGVDLILPDLDTLRTLVVAHSDWLSTTRGGC